jgi:hypothetical protein
MTVMSGSKRIDRERVVCVQHDDETGKWQLVFRYGEKDTRIMLSDEAMKAVVEGFFAHGGTL